MKLSEYKNEDALDLLADLIEPAYVIMTDETFRDMIGTANKMQMIRRNRDKVQLLRGFTGDADCRMNVKLRFAAKVHLCVR